MAVDRSSDNACRRGDLTHAGIGVGAQHFECDVEDAIARLGCRARARGVRAIAPCLHTGVQWSTLHTSVQRDISLHLDAQGEWPWPH